MTQPVVVLKQRTLKTAVFENTLPNSDHVTRNIVISKSYKDKNDTWQTMQITVSQDQISDLAQLLEHTWWEINQLNDKPKQKTEEEKALEQTLNDIPF